MIEVPCILQDALRIGVISPMDWRIVPPDETAKSAINRIGHAKNGLLEVFSDISNPPIRHP